MVHAIKKPAISLSPMKKIFSLIFILSVLNLNGQDRKIDQLEMFYAQGYYAKVLRKANKLLADPLYDYSGLPSYYKALALFRLAEDPLWFKKHPSGIDDAIAAYADFADHEKIKDYVYAHYFELASLKTYLTELEQNFRERGLIGTADKLKIFIAEDLGKIKSRPDEEPIKNNDKPKDSTIQASDLRNQIVTYAKQYIGVKYVWSGTDANGFDCSGFTSYVMKKFNIILSRTASGQLSESKQIKIEHAQKADLVFFGSDGKITHVGLVTSEKGAELEMIHASTSKGVIITNIIQSTYWNPKLQATGTYLQ